MKKKIITGYVGRLIKPSDLFEWKKLDEDAEGGEILDRKYNISKDKESEVWKKVKLTIEILDEDDDGLLKYIPSNTQKYSGVLFNTETGFSKEGRKLLDQLRELALKEKR